MISMLNSSAVMGERKDKTDLHHCLSSTKTQQKGTTWNNIMQIISSCICCVFWSNSFLSMFGRTVLGRTVLGRTLKRS